MQEYQIEAQKKAEVLVEALPYIQKFNRKIIVVKYGGSAMTDEALESNVIKDVTLLKLVGFKPIIVHGGGKAISSWVKKSGKEAKFVNGLRVTDAETMEIAEMVLGRLSKKLVTMVEQLGSKAVGISGKDGTDRPGRELCHLQHQRRRSSLPDRKGGRCRQARLPDGCGGPLPRLQ